MLKINYKLVILMVLLWTSMLNASIIPVGINSYGLATQSKSYNMQIDPVQLSSDFFPGFSCPISIPQFDPSSGILSSVDINYSFSLSGTVRAFNSSNSTITLNPGDLYAFVGFAHNINITSLLEKGFTLDSIEPEQEVILNSEGVFYSDNRAFSINQSNYLDEYIGSNNINITFYGNLGSKHGAISITSESYADAYYQVIYNYVVPEPVSLLVLGVGGMGLLRKRRYTK